MRLKKVSPGSLQTRKADETRRTAMALARYLMKREESTFIQPQSRFKLAERYQISMFPGEQSMETQKGSVRRALEEALDSGNDEF